MTNRQAYEEAAGMSLDPLFFSLNRIDPDAEYVRYMIPAECYKDYGADLDGCSSQESMGCKGCKRLIEIK